MGHAKRLRLQSISWQLPRCIELFVRSVGMSTGLLKMTVDGSCDGDWRTRGSVVEPMRIPENSRLQDISVSFSARQTWWVVSLEEDKRRMILTWFLYVVTKYMVCLRETRGVKRLSRAPHHVTSFEYDEIVPLSSKIVLIFLVVGIPLDMVRLSFLFFTMPETRASTKRQESSANLSGKSSDNRVVDKSQTQQISTGSKMETMGDASSEMVSLQRELDKVQSVTRLLVSLRRC